MYRRLPVGRPVRGAEDGSGDAAAPQSGQRPLQLHAAAGGGRDGADGDAQDGRVGGVTHDDITDRPQGEETQTHFNVNVNNVRIISLTSQT